MGKYIHYSLAAGMYHLAFKTKLCINLTRLFFGINFQGLNQITVKRKISFIFSNCFKILQGATVFPRLDFLPPGPRQGRKILEDNI